MIITPSKDNFKNSLKMSRYGDNFRVMELPTSIHHFILDVVINKTLSIKSYIRWLGVDITYETKEARSIKNHRTIIL